MKNKSTKLSKLDGSIAGQSAAHFVSADDSLAELLTSHGIKVRDFILLSFLSDQGKMTVAQLARVVGISSSKVQRSLQRLAAASLVISDPISANAENEERLTLTDRGQNVLERIGDSLP